MRTKSVNRKRRQLKEQRSNYLTLPSAKPHSMMRVVRRSKWPKEATVQQQAATTELVRRLGSAYPDRILSVVLFGSVARGVSKPESDIDILIIASNADADFEWDVLGIGARVSLECNVIFNLHIYSQELWETLRAARRTLWRNVKQEGIQLTLRPLAA